MTDTKHTRCLLGVLLLAPFMAQADATIANVATPSIRADLGASGAATLTIANATYYALLFTLAQYLQQGLLRGALVSGLTLVPWVAAFGVAGQVVHRLPARPRRLAPTAGCVLLAFAYGAISIALFAGRPDEPLLLVLLAAGGLGLGLQFSALLAHLTTVVPIEYAADISGVSTTTISVGGVLGVAAVGTLYLDLAGAGAHATHAFAVTTAVLAGLALCAAALSARATAAPAPAR